MALFVALTTGIAYALENNSVKSKHVAPDALKGKDIDESSLGSVPTLAIQGFDVTGAELLGEAGSGQVLGRIDDAVTGTSFASPLGQSLTTPTESSQVMGTFLSGAEASELQIQLLSGTMPAASSRTFTLRSGDTLGTMADTTLTCTINAGGDGCSEEDATGLGQFEDLLSFEMTTTGTPGTQDFAFGYALTPQGGVVVP